MTLTGLAFRNIQRNRARTILTILGVTIATLTFLLLRTLLYAWTSASDYAQKDRVVTRHKVTFVMTVPKRYIDDIRQIPEVKVAAFANWFGGKDPKHEKEFFGNFAVDPPYFDVYSEMSVKPPELEAWKLDRQGAIVGDVLATKFGWKVGDKVTLESGIYPSPADSPWTFNISGIYTTTAKSIDRSSMMFHYEYLNDALPESRKDQIGWVVSRTKPGVNAADLGVTIDRLFDSRDTQTVSQDEAAFNASFLAGISAILTALDVISVVILFIMALILGNTIAMGVRERTTEYGVLRAIGFKPGHIAGFIVGESVFIALIGGGLGVLVAYPFVEGLVGRFLEENMGQFFPYFRMAKKDVIAAFALSLILGGLAAAVPAWLASRLKVVEALRRTV